MLEVLSLLAALLFQRRVFIRGFTHWLLADSDPAYAVSSHSGVERQLTQWPPPVLIAKLFHWIGFQVWVLEPHRAISGMALTSRTAMYSHTGCSMHNTLRNTILTSCCRQLCGRCQKNTLKRGFFFLIQTNVPYVPAVALPSSYQGWHDQGPSGPLGTVSFG